MWKFGTTLVHPLVILQIKNKGESGMEDKKNDGHKTASEAGTPTATPTAGNVPLTKINENFNQISNKSISHFVCKNR